MTDKPISNPAKGNVYLKDIPIGSLFTTDIFKGILLDVSLSSASVVITERYSNDKDNAKSIQYWCDEVIVEIEETILEVNKL